MGSKCQSQKLGLLSPSHRWSVLQHHLLSPVKIVKLPGLLQTLEEQRLSIMYAETCRIDKTKPDVPLVQEGFYYFKGSSFLAEFCIDILMEKYHMSPEEQLLSFPRYYAVFVLEGV